MPKKAYADPNGNPPVRDRRLDILRFAQQLMLFGFAATVALSLFTFRDNIRDAYAEYRSSIQLEETKADSRINFEPDSSNIFGLFGNNLAVLNQGTYKLYTPAGDEQLAMQYISANPAMSVSETYVCIYSRGSTTLTVTGQTSKAGTITVSGGIIDVVQNDAGYIAVVHNDDRYRSVVSVFDPTLQLRYEWKTSEYYVQTAALSPDGKTLGVVALTQDDAVFITRVITFLLAEENYHSVCDIPETIVTDLTFLGNEALCAVGDTRACVLNLDGSIRYEYDYGGNSLRTCDYDSAVCVLSVVDRTSGLASYLVSLSAGAEPVIVETDEIRWIDVNSGYVALLYTDTVEVRDTMLNPLGKPVTVYNVRRVFMTSAGKALLIYTSEAGVVDLITPFLQK